MPGVSNRHDRVIRNIETRSRWWLTNLRVAFRSLPIKGIIQPCNEFAEYLDHARRFERLAADENPVIKAQFEKQAEAYRKLAERRAAFLRSVTPKISKDA